MFLLPGKMQPNFGMMGAWVSGGQLLRLSANVNSLDADTTGDERSMAGTKRFVISVGACFFQYGHPSMLGGWKLSRGLSNPPCFVNPPLWSVD